MMIDPENASDELSAVFAEIAAARGGGVGNVFRAMGTNPATLQGVGAVGAHFRRSTVLTPEIKELLVLAVAHQRRCDYEWAHHRRAAAQLGFTAEDIAGHLEDSADPLIGATVQVARAIATGAVVESTDLDTIRDAGGDAAVVEVLTMAGYYVLLAGVISALDVPLETGVRVPAYPDE